MKKHKEPEILPLITRITSILKKIFGSIRAICARLGAAFRLRGAAKRRYGATTAGEARVIRGLNIKFLSTYLILFPAFLFFTAGCGSPRIAYRPDAEIERNAAAAKSAYTTGSLESASAFYQKALNRARLMDQSAEIARMAYNLAACRAQTQKYNEALELLDEAQFESSKTGFYLPEAVLLKAEIFRQLGQTNEALAAAESGLNAFNDKKGGVARLQLNVFLAESACDQNDGKLALTELGKIDPNLLKSSDPVVQAKAAHARGRALAIEKRFAEAAGSFDNAAAFYQKARQYPDMALALQKAGAAYQADDKRPEALNRHYRAARSLFLCGENTEALESFNEAGKLANELNDKQMLGALARLKTEIRFEAEGTEISPQKTAAE